MIISRGLPSLALTVVVFAAANAACATETEHETGRYSPVIGRILASAGMRADSVQSISLTYTRQIVDPTEESDALEEVLRKGARTVYNGTYMASGERRYNQETTQMGVRKTFAYDGNTIRLRPDDSESFVSITRTPGRLRPALQDPWDDQESGATARLADPNQAVVTAFALTEVDGRKCARIVLTGRSGPKQLPKKEILWYALDTYSLLRAETWIDGRKFGEYRMLRERVFDVNGNSVPMILTSRQIVYDPNVDDRISYVVEYAINEDSVAFNPDIPDERFVLEIRPDDKIYDNDLALYVRDPRRHVDLGVDAAAQGPDWQEIEQTIGSSVSGQERRSTSAPTEPAMSDESADFQDPVSASDSSDSSRTVMLIIGASLVGVGLVLLMAWRAKNRAGSRSRGAG